MAAWRVLAVLTLANVLNFYDRALPGILVEPVAAEFGLSDTMIGTLGSLFVVVYALAGLHLGRLTDRYSRRRILVLGVLAWSTFTALTGAASSLLILLIARAGVGIGEAAFAPAANSLIGERFPTERRGRATAVLQLGIPVGFVLAALTVGPVVNSFGTWRAPFVLAAAAGCVVAAMLYRMPADRRPPADHDSGSIRSIMALVSIAEVRWLVLSGIGIQIASYAVATFLTAYVQRYFGLTLTRAATTVGVTVGASAVLGLLLGGVLADRARKRSSAARSAAGGLAVLAAVPLTALSFTFSSRSFEAFVVVFSAGWLCVNAFHSAALATLFDVVPPQQRGSAVGVFYAAFYLLGGALGPVLVGALSDILGAGTAAATGLRHSLLLVVPCALMLASLGLLGAARRQKR
ncbi:MFS transporter [Rhodococcus sp. UNC23MFCrub1.1]|uniref:MFS transporter n=1 Tax=Rhodococcus sp. UNC23MFCrub1.1 TaxID=1449068 RepID=UPI00069063EA|nr:MFS transporter [Rhodococcus sp. UNC23MFCrub1.1]